MESMDFSALLTNMLDNAICASLLEKERDKSAEMIVKVYKNIGYDSIVVKNRISESVLEDNPELTTTKEDSDEHGKGVPQIRDIAEKYEGMYDFYEEDGYFISCVFIPI